VYRNPLLGLRTLLTGWLPSKTLVKSAIFYLGSALIEINNLLSLLVCLKGLKLTP